MARAFSISGRLCGVDDAEHGRYRFRPFKVQSTSLEFSWSQRAVLRQRAIASNVTAVHTPDFTETLINGILQGRKVSDPRGASRISRRKQWAQAFEVARFSNECEVKTALEGATYEALKDSTILEARRQMKERIKRQALAGWTKNIGDGQFSIDL
jgi:tRNA-specific adenosine deaminase 1